MDRKELEKSITQNFRKLNDLEIKNVFEGVKNLHDLLLKLIETENGSGNESKNEVVGSMMNKVDRIVDSSTVNTVSSVMNEKKEKRIKYEEFIELQDKVGYNITNQILILLVRFTKFDVTENENENENEETKEMIVLMLRILQGVLLIHPQSRKCFKGKYNIELLMNILNPRSEMKPTFLMIIECVLMLVSLFIRNAENLRNFEELGGIELICQLIKGEDEDLGGNEGGDKEGKDGLTWQNVRIKSLEFLFFYLIPEFEPELELELETEIENEDGKIGEGKETIVVEEDGIVRRSMESKIRILKKYLNEEFVEGIVTEFVRDKPFGSTVTRW